MSQMGIILQEVDEKHKINHLNMLELKSIFIGMQKYCEEKSYKHVRVVSNNITACLM